MLGPSIETLAQDRVADLVEGWWSTTASGAGMVVPDGAIDLMWAGGTPFLAGPDTEPRRAELAAGQHIVGLRLRPCVAQALLHDDVDQVTDRIVTIDQFVHRATVAQIDESLACSPSATDAALVLAGLVQDLVPRTWSADEVVVAAIERVRAAQPLSELPVSERQLRRRFTRAVGYGPTFFRRVSRLDRFTTLARTRPAWSNAELAAAAGFFDEAHLARDAKALTGSTPGQLR